MMKWWGWGDPDFTFPMKDRPALWPFVKHVLGIEKEIPSFPIQRKEIVLPEPKIHKEFVQALGKVLEASQILTEEKERLLHSYGKSFPDLFRVRLGIVKNPPDMIVLPRRHEDVVAIIRLANQHGVVVIPFGGGTNIVGAVESTEQKKRMVVSLDLREMTRLLAIDSYSLTATIEAGALGPKLEADLETHGYALGHYPDSFQYSTLGGWIATRSAGMQSDEYGRIEDMVVSLNVVTPAGEILTKNVPASSAGPDVNGFLIGSEGTLGVITQATMRIHPLPKVKDYRGFLFKTFDDGVRAIHECYQQNYLPSMIRLQDQFETELAFNMKEPKKGLMSYVHKLMKVVIKYKGYTAPCILVVGFEGDETQVEFTREKVFAIFEKWGSFSLGGSVGKTWSKDKFNIPYLRDYIMDYSCFADVAETAATWTQLLPLYHATIAVMKEKFLEEPTRKGYIGCHLSHSYKTGACLYFTYSNIQQPGRELEQYYGYKKLITETFLQNGGALTHHHAVGYEHLPWLEEEMSPAGLKAFQGLKQALDPQGIMNPGKIIPESAHQYMKVTQEQKTEAA